MEWKSVVVNNLNWHLLLFPDSATSREIHIKYLKVPKSLMSVAAMRAIVETSLELVGGQIEKRNFLHQYSLIKI